jgi:predicted GNAT family acetyltransferase
MPGWTEISAVCTDEDYRGRGLASRLVNAVTVGVLERGDTPFLHVRPENIAASRVYEHLGFKERRLVTFGTLRVPHDAV